MGEYTTRPVNNAEIKAIVSGIMNGFTDYEGIRHKPNKQIGTILLLQANLGCRIGDICGLTVDNFESDNGTYKLNLTEQKTGKKRYFIVPSPVMELVYKWINDNEVYSGRLFSVNEYAVWKQLRAITRTLGYENVSAHSFRKNAAIRTYEASGKDIALTSQFLNHSSTATTLTYLKRSSKQMDEVLSRSVVMM